MTKSLLSFLTALLLSVATALAQSVTVKGIVVSASDDEPLIGASIVSEETKDGVASDIDGNFTITVPEGSKITVSYVGYKSKTVVAEPQMTIILSEDAAVLDEVVVVGYSAEKKADLTGSVSVVKMKDVADTPTGNVL